MPEKPRVAFYWCASCGGCEEAVIDTADGILDIASAVDIVFWPAALDFKRKDVEAMPDSSIQITFLNGAIRTTEQSEIVHLLRAKSQLLVAFGTCSHLGGIPGLANLSLRQEILDAVYLDSPSTINTDRALPATNCTRNGQTLDLPALDQWVRTLHQVVEVDYYLPGCPPTSRMFVEALQTLLGGKLPSRGTVLAPDRALCEECPRKDTKPEKVSLTGFRRPQELLIDEQTCLLAQGLLCCGPATRGGCEASCLKGNMPCTGCSGPTSRVKDQGAKIVSSLAALIESKNEQEIVGILETIPDPVGSFYRYSLPASLIGKKDGRKASEPDLALK